MPHTTHKLDAMLRNPHDRRQKPSVFPVAAQWAGIAVFVVCLALSGVWALTDHWRRASFALGVAMLWLTLLRATCDSRVMGILAVRSRRFDMAFTAVLGSALVFLALSVDSLGSG
ncbi:DUF3017 domain-containing protein [Corynebacterium aquilae]|uniref:Membrane protein n=1 Tax=Corynebacterium aquilae DSM 44791 TaxID=1431546 RepID=A0A1L7CE47_9CORY|nr:DUF3017 domain-containing protein [Corynebacterium aquilae]APT84121.1 membrane protein [Corynebacterium aquilae DSM 44791]